MPIKAIKSAPVYRAKIARNRMQVSDTNQVKSMLGRLGYAWEPRAKVLVRYAHGYRIERALAYFGSVSTLPHHAKAIYQLR